MLIYITSEERTAVSIYMKSGFLAGTDKTVFRIDEPKIGDAADAVITLTPVDESGRLPICAAIRIGNTEGAGNGGEGLAAEPCGACGVRKIDWGRIGAERRLELAVRYPLRPASGQAVLLQRLEVEPEPGGQGEGESKGEGESEGVTLELYRDDGLRLVSRSAERERGYLLCPGRGGSMRLLDAGFARFIIVHVKGCPVPESGESAQNGAANGKSSESAPCFEECERLIVLTLAFERFGSVSGDRCFIEDGLLTVTDELGTVLGHQCKRSYELCAEGLKCLGESDSDEFFAEQSATYPEESECIGEIGFFTHAARMPGTDKEKALAFLECLLLGREAEAAALLSPALMAGLGYNAIVDFFGDFDEARIAPWQTGSEGNDFETNESNRYENGKSVESASEIGESFESAGENGGNKNGLPIMGAVKGGIARSYAFEFERGLISDISEYDTHDLPPVEAGARE